MWWSGSRSSWRDGVECGREFAGPLFARHAVHHEVARSCVGVRVDFAVVDQAAARGPDGVVHGVVDGVSGAGGEGVRLHGPSRTIGFDGDEHSVVRHGLSVCLVEGIGAAGVWDEVGGAGDRQRLHEEIV